MKIYRCQFCSYNQIANKTLKGQKSPKYLMGRHYEMKHKSLLPPDMSGYEYFYFLLTKKDHGECVMCHKETRFNEETMKYCRFCDDPKCKQKYKEIVDQRMIGKYGKVTLLNDAAHQAKMQQGRRISGIYTWSDNSAKFPYLGSYEEDYLKHMDFGLHWPSADLIMPSPHTYTYECNGVTHFYMPDAFIPSLNAEIEIKSSTRMEKQNPESREKEIKKMEMMKSCSHLFFFFVIYDKNYTEFDDWVQKQGSREE